LPNYEAFFCIPKNIFEKIKLKNILTYIDSKRGVELEKI
tara:strand:+ start:671 stop:787 length:117 start_codon:yes stop_codon:yes gene_type:complete